MSELDQLREMVKRDGLEDFVEFASIEELVARQDAEIDRLRAENAHLHGGLVQLREELTGARAEVEALRKVLEESMRSLATIERRAIEGGGEIDLEARSTINAIGRALGRDAG